MIDQSFFTEEGLSLETPLLYFRKGESKDDVRIRTTLYLGQSSIIQAAGAELVVKVKIAHKEGSSEVTCVLSSLEEFVQLIHRSINAGGFGNLIMGVHFYDKERAVAFVATEDMPRCNQWIGGLAHAG